MDRARAKQVGATIQDLIEDAIDAMGLVLVSRGDSFDHNELTVKIIIAEKTALAEAATATVDQNIINAGLAPAGSRVWAMENGLFYRAEILSRKRTNYVFRFLNYPDQGTYRTRFTYLRQNVSPDQIADGEE